MTRSDDPRLEATVRFRDLAETLVRRKRLILLLAIPVIAASILYSYSRTPVYRSTTKLLVRPSFSDITTQIRPSDISAQTETNLATSVAVAEVAGPMMASSLTPQELLKHVTADMTQGTQVLTITYTASSAQAAQRGAKAFGDAYLQYRRDQAHAWVEQQTQTLSGQIDSERQSLAKLDNQLQHLPAGPERTDKEIARSLGQTRITTLQGNLLAVQSTTTDPGEVIDPAILPAAPISPRHSFDLALGLVLGLGLGIVIALVRERNSDSIRSVGELEDVLRVQVLAAVPRSPWGTRERAALVVARGQRTPSADAYRRLRTNLLALLEQQNARTVLVTSADRGEGKTTTVVNLGTALAEIGKRVVLVSADLRRPVFQRIFPTSDEVGLSQVLADGVSPKEVLRDTILNLQIVHSGTLLPALEPVNLLQTERMQRFLHECSENADFVLLDSPPVLGAPDTLVLAQLVDAVLFVADSWKARWDDIIVARDQITRAGGTMIAGVLNRVDLPRRNRRTYGVEWQLRRLHPRLFGGRGSGQPLAESGEPDRTSADEQHASADRNGSSLAEGNGSGRALRHDDVAGAEPGA